MKILVPGRGYQELNGDLVRRSLGIGSSPLKRAQDAAADERRAANKIIERLTDAVHVARGALLGIDTAYSRQVADDLASALLTNSAGEDEHKM